MKKQVSRSDNFINILSLIILVVVMNACASEIIIPSKVYVRDVNQVSNATTNALVYALPTTVIRVEVEAEKNISKVGPFYRYSKKMLNVSDVVVEDKEEWSLKSVKIYTIGQPDENRMFSISYSGENVAPYINLSDDGILAGVNLIHQPVLNSSLQSKPIVELPSLSNVSFDAVPMLETQLSKTSTAAMAEETAAFIYKIRKRRFKILASDYPVLPPDGKSYEITVSELNQLEEVFMELFVGKKESFSITKTFDFIPDSMSMANGVLCRFSSQKGILEPMDLNGTPVYIELAVEKPKSLPDAPIVSEDNEPLRQGLFYCTPAKGLVKIIDRNILMLEQEVLIGQFGQLISLPSEVMEKNNVRIELDPVTGALKSISKE